MATLVLGSIGASIAGSLGATAMLTPALTSAAKLAGNLLGANIDSQLFDGGKKIVSHGPSLIDPKIQCDIHGRIIPNIYGTCKVGGYIIWASKIKETIQQNNQISREKNRSITHIHNNYNYSVSLAIALCEGPIASVRKIWADDYLLSDNDCEIRVYNGSELQQPDPLIEATQGIGKTPAYRGIAYVVLENLDLSRFGNRLPNFSFELCKGNALTNSLESQISAINIIPGSGEFVYDTKVQKKCLNIQQNKVLALNQHHSIGKSNSIVSLNQLQETLPNIKWISVVVNWFATSDDIANCDVMPGVEYSNGATTPDLWKVNGLTREQAYKIRYVEGRPNYGGTVNDASLLRYLEELKKRGYKVMLNPMFLVDLPHKPWRGHMRAKSENIENFFCKNKGYNDFILHYAKLCHNLVDAFLIGSELVSINKVKANNNSFPGVTKLCDLAQQVRNILGASVKISYAADWSEYHHTDGGWFHLDELWADQNIDFIGIDAYFPLTNWSSNKYNLKEIMHGWNSGEGFDFYFKDTKKIEKTRMGPKYAWKNIEWWFNNRHINPNGVASKWVPKAKKIWFTEYGFPSVDMATNEPNVFFDPNAPLDKQFPRGSQGKVDILAQRLGITAIEKYWRKSDIVEQKFLWAWDARPFPTWPQRSDIWGDWAVWEKGHWVQGKLGTTTLAQVIIELCERVGIMASNLDISCLHNIIDGLVINQDASIKDIFDLLQQVYLFDIVENGFKLKFIPRTDKKPCIITENELIIPNSDKIGNDSATCSDIFNINTSQALEMPGKLVVSYLDRNANYRNKYLTMTQPDGMGNKSMALHLPLVLDSGYAASLAQTILQNIWAEKTTFCFSLPFKYAFLKPSDILEIMVNDIRHNMRIVNIELGLNKILQIFAVKEDIRIYNFDPKWLNWGDLAMHNSNKVEQTICDTKSEIFEPYNLPVLNLGTSNTKASNLSESCFSLILSCHGISDNWPGCRLYFKTELEAPWELITDNIFEETTAGISYNYSNIRVNPNIIDKTNSFYVSLPQKTKLYSKNSLAALLNSQNNIAFFGNEIIKFGKAELIGKGIYKVSQLLRGLYGTENKINENKDNARFVLIDNTLRRIYIDKKFANHMLFFKVLTNGTLLNDDSLPDFKIFPQHHLECPLTVVEAQIENKSMIVGDYLRITWIARHRSLDKLFSLLSMPQLLSQLNMMFFITLSRDKEIIFETSVVQQNFCDIPKKLLKCEGGNNDVNAKFQGAETYTAQIYSINLENNSKSDKCEIILPSFRS